MDIDDETFPDEYKEIIRRLRKAMEDPKTADLETSLTDSMPLLSPTCSTRKKNEALSAQIEDLKKPRMSPIITNRLRKY